MICNTQWFQCKIISMYNVETPKKIHDCIHMFFRASSYQIIYDIAYDFFWETVHS